MSSSYYKGLKTRKKKDKHTGYLWNLSMALLNTRSAGYDYKDKHITNTSTI